MRRLNSFVQAAAAWMGPRSRSYDLIRIYAVGGIVAFFFLYFGDFWIEPGGYDYVTIAQAILNGTNFGSGVPNGDWGRDIGMALIWIISGYPFTHSLVGVVIIQVLMGLAMPPLSYLALRPWFPRTAYYTALAECISLSPFLMMKFIEHDQPYIFFTVASVYLANRFFRTGAVKYIYASTVSIYLLGLIREAGYGLFWLLMPAFFLQSRRKSYWHIALAAVLLIGVNAAYARYKDRLEGRLAIPGLALFQNLYINAAEFGVTLSPDIGPTVKLILHRVYMCSLPSPAKSPYITRFFRISHPPADYMAKHFYKYTADELVEKVATQPNLQYSQLIEACISDRPAVRGQILLQAWLEIVRAHPLYLLELFLRNSLELLYDPGWLHNQYDTRPQFKGGLVFPFGDNTYPEQGGPIEDTRFPPPMLTEAGFIPLARHALVTKIYFAIYHAWYGLYEQVTVILGCLAWFAWISTVIGLLQRAIGGPLLTRWSTLWLSNQVIPASIAISILLLGNVAITAIAEETIYRYDFSLLLLKIMLAGVGGAILIRFLRCFLLALTARLRASTRPGVDERYG